MQKINLLPWRHKLLLQSCFTRIRIVLMIGFILATLIAGLYVQVSLQANDMDVQYQFWKKENQYWQLQHEKLEDIKEDLDSLANYHREEISPYLERQKSIVRLIRLLNSWPEIISLNSLSVYPNLFVIEGVYFNEESVTELQKRLSDLPGYLRLNNFQIEEFSGSPATVKLEVLYE